MQVHTLTIDDNDISTFAFATEAECYAQLRELYPEHAALSDGDLITELTERQGVVLYIDAHEVDTNALPAIMPEEDEESAPVQVAEHFHPGEYYGCRKDHRQDHRP